ncbi:Hsp20 family protein [Pelagibius litoralis]|uniref:Hsp20 family protein n=1 Tax=Pelagibius litoralis TaxID=374515 RepID=A0A967K8L7_9PROT|nr:Hsp20 family protein [Pelagibius litoralis]NIA70528.1 Hsp20 family protein [Pelagibius litoralis]
MRSLDLSPLFRATVGFDRLASALDTASRLDESAYSYPPYNIERTGEDSYRIVMAVAGFAEDELDITAKENSLTITGKKTPVEDDQTNYLHRGIAARAFERRFDLADYIKVADAKLENGLLSVDLVREVPEAKKPRSIKITSAIGSAKVLENEAA